MPSSGSIYAYRPAHRPSAMTASSLQSWLLERSHPPNVDPDRLFRAGSREPRRTVLVLLEAVNAGGKDGVIRESSGWLGETRMRVERLRRPIPGEPTRDLLLDAARAAPRPGELVFFNRSYYEDPVHAAREGCDDLPTLCDKVVTFEEQLVEHGISLVKLFLHIDKAEQLVRLDNRWRRPEFRHLHNPWDYGDQQRWDVLMRAYDAVLSHTHTAAAPWLMIPGNDRHVRNGAVHELLASALE